MPISRARLHQLVRLWIELRKRESLGQQTGGSCEWRVPVSLLTLNFSLIARPERRRRSDHCPGAKSLCAPLYSLYCPLAGCAPRIPLLPDRDPYIIMAGWRIQGLLARRIDRRLLYVLSRKLNIFNRLHMSRQVQINNSEKEERRDQVSQTHINSLQGEREQRACVCLRALALAGTVSFLPTIL